MPNYQLGKIYKIVDNTNENVYVGSTCEPTLARRLASHVVKYKSYVLGSCIFVTSFKIIQNGDYDIVLIENYPCNNKDELHARERYYIETTDCVNKNIPNRTHKESTQQYYIKNKDKFAEYNKQYQMNNKEQINKQREQYRQENRAKINLKYTCVCGGKYTHANKSQHIKSKKHTKYLKNV